MTNLTAAYWEYYGGRAVFEYWTNQTSQKLFEYRLDTNPPRAARAYALGSVALYDTFVATGDAKYTYWAIRPFMLDETVTTVFATPNHPSYPAFHASLSGAMETVLGALFPRDAATSTGSRRRSAGRGCGPASTSALTSRSAAPSAAASVGPWSSGHARTARTDRRTTGGSKRERGRPLAAPSVFLTLSA